jgi:hypothetical protein
MKKTFIAAALTGLLAMASAHADTITFSADRAIGTTDWTSLLSIGKFDTSLGHLNSITFNLSGTVQGIGSAESLDNDATNVLLSLGSSLTLARPNGSTLTAVNPNYSQSFSFAEFDGEIDFAGASGGSTGLRLATATSSFSSSSASDFALFSSHGGGLINLGISATGAADASGSGNLATEFSTSAGARVSVTYNYAPVPEPETYAMMLAGLGLLALARRRKAVKKIG